MSERGPKIAPDPELRCVQCGRRPVSVTFALATGWVCIEGEWRCSAHRGSLVDRPDVN